jgi:PAS domain S-box-containing protein
MLSNNSHAQPNPAASELQSHTDVVNELLFQSPEPLAKILDLTEDAILSVGEDQRLLLFNHGAEKMFGYTAAEVCGGPLDMLLPERFVAMHPVHMSTFAESSVAARRMGERREVFGRRKDGTEFPAEATISKVRMNDRWIFSAILRDVTDRKKADEQIRTSLREKELLLKEIHHRVKNNLQVISSLLGLQARAALSGEVKRIFQDSQNRIHSMALLHERLYKSDSLSEIDCSEYVRELAGQLFRSFGVNSNRVQLTIDIEDVSMNMDTALPCGLILNEVISNSLKYAFPGGQDGEIHVHLSSTDATSYRLLVHDNGTGLPEGLDVSTTRTLGWRLIRTLADQLGARIDVRSDDGTEIELRFPRSDK